MPTILQKILPEEGNYCIVGLKDKENPQQSFHSDWDAIETQIEDLRQGDFNVYFACASFTES